MRGRGSWLPGAVVAVVAMAWAWVVMVDHGPPRAVVGWFDGGYEAPLPLEAWPVVDVTLGGVGDVGALAESIGEGLGDVGVVARVDAEERLVVVVPAAADGRGAVEERLAADRTALEILPVLPEGDEVVVAIRHWVRDHRDAAGEVEEAPGALLEGPTEEAIAAALAAAEAGCEGCRMRAPLAVRYEAGRVYRGADGSEREVVVAYLVSRAEPRLDGRFVAQAQVTYDDRNRPAVMVDFDGEGAARLAELSERQVGEKLAIVVEGRVVSAPVVMERISGGRAQIALGSDGGVVEARRLAAGLGPGVALPEGTTWAWRESAGASEGAVLVSRAATALAAGLLALLVGGLLGRWARLAPAGATARTVGGEERAPWAVVGRVGVTLAACAAPWALGEVPAVGVSEELGGGVSLGALGLMPVLVAYLVVRAVVWVAPGLRGLRGGDAAARRRLLPVTALLAVGLGGLQAYAYGWSLSGYGVVDAGVGPVLVVAGSLVAGMVALWVVAAVVSRWGVGDGFVVLMVAAVGATVVAVGGGEHEGGGGAATVASMVALGVLYAHLCGRRVGAGEGARVLPLGGLVPLELVAILGFVAVLLGEHWGAVVGEVTLPVRLAVLVVGGVGLAWVTARPIAGGAFARGAAVSVGALVLVMAAQAVAVADGAFVLGDVALLATVVAAPALVVDVAGEVWVTARHGALAPVWSGHGVDEARGHAEALGRAGVPFAVRSARYRALTRFMGPWAPVAVLVPAAHAERAARIVREREHAGLIEAFGDGAG